jgi:hypothetical protein
VLVEPQGQTPWPKLKKEPRGLSLRLESQGDRFPGPKQKKPRDLTPWLIAQIQLVQKSVSGHDSYRA